MYSSLKYFKVDNTGFGAVLPQPHKEPSFTDLANSSSKSKSDISPLPATIFCKIFNIFFVPSLQGTHLPQLSFCVKFIKNLATSTIQVSSAITTSPPVPIIAPALIKLSSSSGKSTCSSVKQPPD